MYYVGRRTNTKCYIWAAPNTNALSAARLGVNDTENGKQIHLQKRTKKEPVNNFTFPKLIIRDNNGENKNKK